MVTETPNQTPQHDPVELAGFSTRLLLALTCARWGDVLALLDWLSAQNAVPVYVLHRASDETLETTLHIENLSAGRLHDWLREARRLGKVRAARVEHLLVRRPT